MSVVGYSGKPLVDKLGYLAGDKVYTFYAPFKFSNLLRDEGVQVSREPTATWGHAFFYSQSGLQDFLDKHNLDDFEKGLWVSWPKKSSGVETDLTEQSFRDAILPLGWVDTKVCAIDDTWSGLKFLRRKK